MGWRTKISVSLIAWICFFALFFDIYYTLRFYKENQKENIFSVFKKCYSIFMKTAKAELMTTDWKLIRKKNKITSYKTDGT